MAKVVAAVIAVAAFATVADAVLSIEGGPRVSSTIAMKLSPG